MFFNRLFASPQNPYMPDKDKSEALTFNLSGTKFSLMIPPSSRRSLKKYQETFSTINIFNRKIYDKRNRNALPPHCISHCLTSRL